MTDWIFEIYDLISQDKDRKAIYVLFKKMDELLSSRSFEEADLVLKRFDFSRLNSTLIVAILSITLGAKEYLSNREEFYRKAEENLNVLIEDPEKVRRLLLNLS